MPKIKKVIIDEDKPVLFDFQNGKIKVNEHNNIQLSIFKDKSTQKNVLGVANSKMIYSGVIDEDNLFDKFLAISRREGKELELIQVDTCTLTPLIKEKAITSSPITPQTVADLKKHFGSKKAKRFTEQQERLTMNFENVKESLENSIANISVPDIAFQQPDENYSIYRPRIDRNASTKEQVYQLSHLIPIKILDTLEKRAIELLESDKINTFSLTPTVENSIITLKCSPLDKGTLLKKCKILLFIHCLISFMNTPLKKITKKYNTCDFSSEIDKHIKQNYMVSGTRPLNMKDKCLCYIIVLYMIAMDYELDLDPLSKDAKVGMNKIKDFSRNLGFSQSSKHKTGITLKIPVPPPVSMHLKRKRNSL